MEEKIVTILNEMAEYLTVSQMKKLQEVILRTFSENVLGCEKSRRMFGTYYSIL